MVTFDAVSPTRMQFDDVPKLSAPLPVATDPLVEMSIGVSVALTKRTVAKVLGPTKPSLASVSQAASASIEVIAAARARERAYMPLPPARGTTDPAASVNA